MMHAHQDVLAILPVEAVIDARLSLLQLRVLVAVSAYRDSLVNAAEPDLDDLAHLVGLTMEQCAEVIGELEELGWMRCGRLWFPEGIFDAH